MKNTQKLAGILLVLVMVLAMVVPTLAATGSSPDTKGSITIKGPVKDQTYTTVSYTHLTLPTILRV